jgi:hypothetical protein
LHFTLTHIALFSSSSTSIHNLWGDVHTSSLKVWTHWRIWPRTWMRFSVRKCESCFLFVVVHSSLVALSLPLIVHVLSSETGILDRQVPLMDEIDTKVRLYNLHSYSVCKCYPLAKGWSWIVYMITAGG